MGAHLFVVPDPEPDEAPGPGERPVLVPALTPAVPSPRQAPKPDVDRPDNPDAPDAPDFPDDPEEDEGQDDQDDQDDEDDEDDAGEYEEEEAAAPRALTVPDLRPYVDPRPLRELGPLAVEAGKVAGPPLLRATVRLLVGSCRMLAWYGRGLHVLLVLTGGWLSGKYGKHGSRAARFGVLAFLAYAVVKLSDQYPYTPRVALSVVLLAILAAATGAIQIPVSKLQKKETEKGKGAKGKTDQAPEKDKTAPAESAEKEAGEVSKEPPAETPRTSWATRLFHRPEDRADTPAEASAQAPVETPAKACADAPGEVREEAPEQSPEEPDEEVPETPREDPLTALLREAIGGENGVHLSVLRPLMRERLPGLSQASDKELREHLVQAGYDPSRTFRARGVAGRAGVHRTELPPLPSPGSAPQEAEDHSPSTLHTPRPAEISGGGEQRRATGEEAERWTLEEMARGWRSAPDPERGPSASRIERWKGDRG